MSAHDRIEPEVLLQHRHFVRKVSRAVVADPHRALDVEQEAWLAAIEHPPRRVEALLEWFRIAIRNIACKAHRGESRRTARERRVASHEVTAATDAIVDRLAVQRDVVDAVLALDAPYRTVIVLRFYEDLGPAAIAVRLELPLRTVRFRLQRGVELLRARLDQHRDREWFHPALLALAGAKAATSVVPVATGAAGVIMLSAKMVVGTVAALALASVVVWLGSELLSDPDPRSRAAAPVVRVVSSAGAAVNAESVPGRQELAGVEPPSPAPTAESTSTASVDPSLPPTGRIKMALQDARTHAPLTKAHLRLMSDRRFADRDVDRVLSEPLSEGVWQASLTAAGHEPLTLTPFAVRAGETTDLGVLVMLPGSGRIDGNVIVPPAVARTPLRVELLGSGRGPCPECDPATTPSAAANLDSMQAMEDQGERTVRYEEHKALANVVRALGSDQALQVRTESTALDYQVESFASSYADASRPAICPTCGYGTDRSVREVGLGEPFSFANLASGSYTLQVLDADGRRLGRVLRVDLAAGQYAWLAIDVAVLLDVEFELRDGLGRPVTGHYTTPTGKVKSIDQPCRYEFFDGEQLLATACVNPELAERSSDRDAAAFIRAAVLSEVQVTVLRWDRLVLEQAVTSAVADHLSLAVAVGGESGEQRIDRERSRDDRLTTPADAEWPAAVTLPASALWPDVHVVRGVPSQPLVLKVNYGPFQSDPMRLDLGAFDGHRVVVVLREKPQCVKSENPDQAMCKSCHD